MSTIYILEDSDERYSQLLSEVSAGLSEENKPTVIRLRTAGSRLPGAPYAVVNARRQFPPEDAAENAGQLSGETEAFAVSGTDGEQDLPALDELYPVPYTRYVPKKDGSYANAQEAAGAVREMIQYNYMRPDSARHYAARVHISLTYLCRAFRRETGKSIGDYILQVRMQKAADHLAHSNLMVKEVARAVGYSNFSYFCRRFRSFYNLTPAEYRNKYRMSLRRNGRKNGKGSRQ